MDVRELTENECDAAVALWHAAGLTRPWGDPVEDFTRAVDGPASCVLGLFDGAELVGTTMVGDDGHRGWVYYLAAHPDRREAGIGRRLMTEAEAWLAHRGVVKLDLMVRTSNAAVLGFYERIGYERDDVVVLSRRLRAPGASGPETPSP